MLLSWPVKQEKIEKYLLQKKLLIFDLDGTLTLSKSDLDSDMSKILEALLYSTYCVAIISGCWFEQMFNQVVKPLIDRCSRNDFFHGMMSRLFLLPMSGTALYRWDRIERRFSCQYKETLSLRDKTKILKAFDSAVVDLNLPKPSYGSIEEDRGSQITFSLLGQQAPLDQKALFDPDGSKRKYIKAKMENDLPDFEICIGGTTSIDVTYKGMDKSYGVRNLLKSIKMHKKNAIFIGDALFDGGNDAPVRNLVVDCVQVRNVSDTKQMLATIAAKKMAMVHGRK